VIARDIEIDEIDPRHWHNWWRLLWPPGLTHENGWAVALLDDVGAVAKVVTSSGNSLTGADAPMNAMTRDELERLRGTLGVELFVAIDEAVPAEVIREAEARPGTDTDPGRLALEYWAAVKKRVQQGRVGTAPPLAEAVPAIGPDELQRTFDLLIPEPSALVAYVFEDDGSDIFSSVIASKEGGDLVFVSTNQIVDDAVVPAAMARRWRHDYHRINRVVGERIDRVSLGAFASRGAVERILSGPPDQMARELAARNVIFDPAPAWLKVLLGGAAVASVATRGAQVLSGFMPKMARKLAGEVAQRAQTTLKETGIDPWASLGFDPIALWLDVRGWFYPPAAGHRPPAARR